MDKKDRIHEEAERIFSVPRDNYSVTELVILLQSQYYNIEDLFTYGANLKGDNIDENIALSEKIISICNSFQNNLKLVPDLIRWEGAEDQIAKVEGIKDEVLKSLELQEAIRRYQVNPSPVNAFELQNIARKLENGH